MDRVKNAETVDSDKNERCFKLRPTNTSNDPRNINNNYNKFNNNNNNNNNGNSENTDADGETEMMLSDGSNTAAAGNNNNQKNDIDDDTKCGYWIFQGPFYQRLANKNVYVFLFGLLGCLYSASYAYFNGIISTMEKRFGIPSKVSGLISSGNNVSQVIISVFVAYYAGRKHKPRWLGFGGYSVVIFCLMSVLPHFIYGPGIDSYDLTKEMNQKNPNISMARFSEILHEKRMLCQEKPRKCDDQNIVAPIILFLAQFISGIGQAVFHSVGTTYLDDNVERSNVPIMISFSYFFRGLGPVAGLLLCSVCLKLYIIPGLTPTITNDDPRWLGAWWLGWLILSVLIFIVSTVITLFPKRLPQPPSHDQELSPVLDHKPLPTSESSTSKASFSDMMETFRRLYKNKPLMYNNISTVFHILGLLPFYIFLPKYVEMVYAKSASLSNLVIGVVTLAFTAVGIFSSGIILTVYKPKARYLAAFNVLVGVIIACGIFSFAFLGCSDLMKLKHVYSHSDHQMACSSNCHCEYVKYTPVCSMDGKTRFVSPCHAGCKNFDKAANRYTNCSCVNKVGLQYENSLRNTSEVVNNDDYVVPGLCSVNCESSFILFLIVLCVLKLIGAASRTSNFLVTIRCVDKQDKSMSIGFGMTIIGVASFIPSPILFGYIFDKYCLYWGSTCTGEGNCWLYDINRLKYVMNFTATFFIAIAVMFDVFVWYYVKNTQIFDEEI